MTSKLFKYQNIFVSCAQKKSEDSDLLESISPIGSLGVKDVMDIYHNDYYARMTEALGETYEAIWYVLGDDDFFEVCRDYISQNPSRFRNLGNYGDNFPDWISNHKISKDFLFLKDLADFELSFINVFHQPEDKFTNPLSKCPMEELGNAKISFIPTFKLFAWDIKIFDIWNDRDETEKEKSQEEYLDSQYLALYKNAPKSKFKKFTKGQFHILSHLVEGKSVSEALELSSGESELNPNDIQDLFQFLNQDGVVEAFRI